jgi:hypothetical protein
MIEASMRVSPTYRRLEEGRRVSSSKRTPIFPTHGSCLCGRPSFRALRHRPGHSVLAADSLQTKLGHYAHVTRVAA